ncbi:DNA primase family protein [Frigoribacterium faeni]|uniref:Phage protein n=1 Tax=Frigoribacterium faeni TaxID=145483 RepID=A0A7W3JGH9_9MICO|nr:phage/plasmid primase, P4 family [Frigoribacterium faeni]MBA8812421.1 putative DNA primase/helicase [Frigoribacterium faeni]BFF13492.1 phage/plasmid primase, P4 family [Microbacterium flavescens]GEK81864.1 phage protein [Frigoribacterium faeni]
MTDLVGQGEPAEVDFDKVAAFYTAFQMQDSLLAELLAEGSIAGANWSEAIADPMTTYLAWTRDRGWLHWEGKVWVSIPDPSATELVRRELKLLFGMLCSRPDVDAHHVKTQYAQLLTESKAKKVTFFLKGLLTRQPDWFDREPDLINCQNGVLDLRTGSLHPHAARWYMTKITDAEYHPRAKHADWNRALQAMPTDIHDYMQARYGQAITGYPTDDDVLLVQTGGGQNGKSTIVNAIVSALGGYGGFVPEKVLLANPGEHPTELMTLRGTRMAVIEETPEGHRLPTKRLKDLVGTPVMTARAMRQDFVSWSTTHTLFLNTNYVPQVAETDHGTWRRLQLVKFPYKFVDPNDPLMAPNEKHGDPGLRDRIRYNKDRQLEAVLAWVVEGAMNYYTNGKRQFSVPLSIQSDTQAWREEADLILAYSKERLTFEPSSSVATTELYEDFSTWLKDSGRSTWNDQTFASRFGGHDLADRNHVTKVRTSSHASIVRRIGGGFAPPLPTKVNVWKGVSFN